MKNLKGNHIWRAMFLVPAIALALMLGTNAVAKPNPGEKEEDMERVHFNLDVQIDMGQTWASESFDIPDGYRFFIDYVTVKATFPAGQVAALQITTFSDYDPGAGPGVQHHFVLTPLGAGISTAPGYHSHFLSEATHIFGDAFMSGWSSDVSIALSRDSDSGPGGGRVSVTGRLVELEGE